MEERIQKILSRAGLGSRRACEELIEQGRVSVNGEMAKLGQKANPQVDRIMVDGKTLEPQEELKYVALNKPRGVVSTVSAPDQRQTVRDLVPLGGHLYPVGRLDVDSEGLILMTNDGELANRLTHPKFGHEKEYRVLFARQPDSEQLESWRRGIVLEDGHRTAPAMIHVDRAHGKGAWARVILKEGRKRQIREMGMLTGLPVVRIIRVRIGSLQLGSLKTGEWRELTPAEVRELKELGTPKAKLKKPMPGQPRVEEKKPGGTGPRPEARKPWNKGQKPGPRGGSQGSANRRSGPLSPGGSRRSSKGSGHSR